MKRIVASSLAAAVLLTVGTWTSIRAFGWQSQDAGTRTFTPAEPATEAVRAPGTPVTATVSRTESGSEALAGAIQLSAELRTRDGTRAVRVLGLFLQLQRYVELDGPTFSFNQHELVGVGDATPVRTAKMGGVDTTSGRFSYRYEVRPARDLNWGMVGNLNDLVIELIRD
jgi:hypothetical protein